MPFNKGDILLPVAPVAKNDLLKGLFHPAVVWSETYDGNTDFTGIMLTHRTPTKRFANVLMAGSHFQNGYTVGFSNTHFVNQVFVKFYIWGPFALVGKLTTDGIAFVESQLDPNSPAQEFTEYLKTI